MGGLERRSSTVRPLDPMDLVIPDDVKIGGGPPEIVISYDQMYQWGEDTARQIMLECQRRGMVIWDERHDRQYRITVGPRTE